MLMLRIPGAGEAATMVWHSRQQIREAEIDVSYKVVR
jgi:hypothetical protein